MRAQQRAGGTPRGSYRWHLHTTNLDPLVTANAFVFQQGRTEKLEKPEDISELIGKAGRVLWVDLYDPSEEDFDLVQDEFSLHPLAMEDARQHGQRPKLEHYPTHAFIVAYSSNLAEVDMFIGPDWMVTVRGHNNDGQEWKVGNVEARLKRTCPHSPTVGF